jgi:hypothetical protein
MTTFKTTPAACRNCGMSNAKGGKFCGGCGSALRDAPEQGPTSEAMYAAHSPTTDVHPQPAGGIRAATEFKNDPRSYPPLLDRLLKGTRLKRTFWFGVVAILFGAVLNGGGSLIILGVLLVALPTWVVLKRWHVARHGALCASGFVEALRSGAEMEVIPPDLVDMRGDALFADEACYVNGAPGDVSLFYGNPVILTRGFVIAWGSPLAFMMSTIFTFGLWSRRRKQAAKAGPQWREATPIDIWVTSQRLVLKTRKGSMDFHMPHDEIVRCAVEGDGIVIVGARSPDVPLKIRTPYAAWISVLEHYLHGETVEVKIPMALSGAQVSATTRYPGLGS